MSETDYNACNARKVKNGACKAFNFRSYFGKSPSPLFYRSSIFWTTNFPANVATGKKKRRECELEVVVRGSLKLGCEAA
jgi:hypothetical protein